MDMELVKEIIAWMIEYWNTGNMDESDVDETVRRYLQFKSGFRIRHVSGGNHHFGKSFCKECIQKESTSSRCLNSNAVLSRIMTELEKHIIESDGGSYFIDFYVVQDVLSSYFK